MDDNVRQQINDCIVGISKGDVFSLEILSSLVSARMLSVAMSVLHDKTLAEDATQEAFVKVVDNAKRFKQGTNGYAWICKIVQNCALNIFRKERRRPTVNLDDCFYLADQADPFGDAEVNLTLKKAMSLLDPTEQAVIYHKYFMDLTVRESAKLFGVGKSSVQRTVERAEKKLQQWLLDGTK